MNSSVLNSICYTIGWFWCVLFGIYKHSWLALMGAVVLIVFQLYYTKKKNLSLYIQDTILVFFSIPLGIFLEILFILTGTIDYPNSIKFFPPIWIVLLYPLFSLVLNHSLQFLKKKYLLTFIFGCLAAPFSYFSGLSLGGLTFSYSPIITAIIIGIFWGVFLSILSKMASLIEKATRDMFAVRDGNHHFKLLYDGQCPICSREVCALRKRNHLNKVHFIDINSQEFALLNHKKIDYKTAMAQIHAIDNQGNILVGLAAFAAVYANCKMPIISTLLHIQFIKFVLTPFYKLFAKSRTLLKKKKQ